MSVHTPPTRWQIVQAAIRPQTLSLTATPILVGVSMAWAEGATPHGGIALATLLTAGLIQIGVNLHNDATDHLRGNDTAARIGPLRVTAAGWASAKSVLRAAYLSLALALGLGISLALAGGPIIVAIGSAALIAALAYSGGPRPLSHTALGELFVWVFFGLAAVAGSHWLQAGQFSAAALIAGAALGLPAAAVLLVNNLRDIDTDRLAGRRTLAARLGEAHSRRLHAALMLTPFLSLPLLASHLQAPWPGLALLALPAGLRVSRRMQLATGPALNAVLADTARAQLQFGGLLSAGCLLTLLLP